MEAYLQKTQLYHKELREALLKENPSADKKQIFDAFDMGYRMEFPGLDYLFFEKVKKSLNI